MEPFKFSQINWDKVKTGHMGLCYHNHELLADLEIIVQRPEARRLGVPDNCPIATHVFIPLRVINTFTISKEVKFLWMKKTKNVTLLPGLWIFEETPSGVQVTLWEKYKNATDIEIRKRVKEFMPNQRLSFQDSVIIKWKESFAYGWISFFTQPEHTVLGADITTHTIRGSMICSQYFAASANDACRAGGELLDFPNETNTNPLECQVSGKYERDTEVQP